MARAQSKRGVRLTHSPSFTSGEGGILRAPRQKVLLPLSFRPELTGFLGLVTGQPSSPVVRGSQE